MPGAVTPDDDGDDDDDNDDDYDDGDMTMIPCRHVIHSIKTINTLVHQSEHRGIN